MGLIGWIILGLIAGVIAQAILPGRRVGGFFATLILGVVGALFGGWLGSWLIPGFDINNFWSFQTWITAIVGSLIVLFLFGLVTRKR
ncbi:MAG: GlsB/YeaQ/YmgE family stress response membrane protein [Microbacteriaceae bacterium]